MTKKNPLNYSTYFGDVPSSRVTFNINKIIVIQWFPFSDSLPSEYLIILNLRFYYLEHFIIKVKSKLVLFNSI